MPVRRAWRARRAARLFSRLIVAPTLAELAVLGQRLERAQLATDRLTQPSPMRSVIKPASRGLLSTIQRRGVTPLVLLLNLCGQSS